MATQTQRAPKTNSLGLTQADYKGSPSTLCAGCGHDSISSQIISVAYELNIRPHEIIKLSGIGCSSKSPAYFLGMSYGFNALHGRMPAVASGALMANHTLRGIGVSGDGDTGSIGMGQFKHLCRRNVRMVYIVENNGVYGLTKGQFSATADEGQKLKYAGVNYFPPMDLCAEAIQAGCGFVARSFSGDPKQVRALLSAALNHRGTAVLDIISPCVTFNNHDESTKSYSYGKEHEIQLHELDFVPKQEEIIIEDYAPGESKDITMHDGSIIRLHKLEADYDPTNRIEALSRLYQAEQKREFITGLIYFNGNRPSFAEVNGLDQQVLAQLSDEQLRPPVSALSEIMESMM